MHPHPSTSATSSPSSFGGNIRPAHVSALSGKVQGLKFMQRAAALNPTTSATDVASSSTTSENVVNLVKSEHVPERPSGKPKIIYADGNQEHWSFAHQTLASPPPPPHTPSAPNAPGWNSWLLQTSTSSFKGKHRQRVDSSQSSPFSTSPIGRRNFGTIQGEKDESSAKGQSKRQEEAEEGEDSLESSKSTNRDVKRGSKKRPSTSRESSLEANSEEERVSPSNTLRDEAKESDHRRGIKSNPAVARYHKEDQNGARKDAKKSKKARKSTEDARVSLQSPRPLALVDYVASSDEEGGEGERDPSKQVVQQAAEAETATVINATKATDKAPLRKPKQLPTVAFPSPTSSATFANRKTVAGEWLCHVYVAIPLKDHPKLVSVLREAKESILATSGPGKRDHFHWYVDEQAASVSLHVSLTQPVLVRGHEKESFTREVRGVLERQAGFALSFSTVSPLPSSASTTIHPPRIYYTLEVGQGHSTMSDLTRALNVVVRSHFQGKTYFEEQEAGPRFHASFGYRQFSSSDDEIEDGGEVDKQEIRKAEQVCCGVEEELGDQIRAVGHARVRCIEVKVGKKITRVWLR